MRELRTPDVVTVAVSRRDGGVTVLRVIVTEYVPDPSDPTQRLVWKHYEPTPEYVDTLIARYVADGHWIGPLAPVSWRFVPNEYVTDQTDRTFRDAWQDDPDGVAPLVHMPTAREIHRERLRQLRRPVLEWLDVEYVRADEHGDIVQKQAIARRKQALRDVTADPAIDAAETPNALQRVIPEVLRGG
jgi:hypothetical protein